MSLRNLSLFFLFGIAGLASILLGGIETPDLPRPRRGRCDRPVFLQTDPDDWASTTGTFLPGSPAPHGGTG